MLPYRHRQMGTVILVAMGIAVVGAGAAAIHSAATGASGAGVAGPVVLLLLVAMALFGSLTVEVDRESIRLWFGPGAIRRRFRIADVIRADVVRNRWLYGWGIRWTPRGWLFNVSGLDAVEIELRSGRVYRIGTDEPHALAQAIGQALGG